MKSVKEILQIFKSFFTFQVPPGAFDSTLKEPSGSSEYQDFGLGESQSLFSNLSKPPFSPSKSSIEKIWIDNTFRAWLSTLTFILCATLSTMSEMISLSSVVILFSIYVVLGLAATWLLFKIRSNRFINFFLCTLDISVLSAGIHITGGTQSPLYFLYFIPLIVQAFHRDWALILFYGFAGVLGYSLAIFLPMKSFEIQRLIDLSARIISMLLAISSSVLAVSLLRKRHEVEKKRLSRMKVLTLVSQRLHQVGYVKDLPKAIRQILGLINEEFSPQFDGWCRVWFTETTGQMMHGLSDDKHQKPELKQELSVSSCPVMTSYLPFVLNNSEKERGCEAESFSFKSHYCLPIMGAANESYGVIFAASDRVSAFGKEEVEFLKFISRAIGLTNQRLKRFEELHLSLEMDSCAMAAFLASTKSLQATYKTILEGIKSLLKADQASLFLWNSEAGNLTVKEVIGSHANQEVNLKIHRGEGFTGRLMNSTQPSFTSDLHTDPTFKNMKIPFKSVMGLPLIGIKAEPIGVVHLWYLDNQKSLSSFEIDTGSTFITRATVALENALLHQTKVIPKSEIHKQNKAA